MSYTELPGALRHLGNQAQRNGQFVQLEMWPDKGHCAEDTGATRHFTHLDLRLTERAFGTKFLGCVIGIHHVLHQPVVEIALDIEHIGEAAHLVAHHGFHVMRDAADSEHVLQLG